MIIQTSHLIYLGIHASLEGPGWSGIGIIQYIWAYCPVHTFEVKGGGHRALEEGQFRNYFFAFFFAFLLQYQLFRYIGTCLTKFRST